MKSKILIGLGGVVIAIAGYIGYRVLTSRSLSPLATTTYHYNGLDMKVVYCRPYKKGRLIFGEVNDNPVRPFGKYWRLGANDATEITFSKDINFAGQPLKAGSYRMYAVPNANTWQISLNSELGAYGATEPNYALDVLKVDVPVETGPETEQFTISFESDSTDATMDFIWDKTLVRIPITIQ